MADSKRRNLRDGQLVISDGQGTPVSLTLILDTGDLSWTETENEVLVLDRGSINANAHVRDGDDVPCELSFSAAWLDLIDNTASAGGAVQLYEFINNVGSNYTTVGTTGEKFQLKYVFTVTGPSGHQNETITFAKVWKRSFEMSEGDDPGNTISFTGASLETRPTIAKA